MTAGLVLKDIVLKKKQHGPDNETQKTSSKNLPYTPTTIVAWDFNTPESPISPPYS